MSDQKKQKQIIKRKKKTALVCSGGAAKAGAFHLGVLLALQEKGFRFIGGLKTPNLQFENTDGKAISVYVGSSAGSLISTFLAAGYDIHQIIDTFVGKKAVFRKAGDKALKKFSYTTMFSLRKDIGFTGIWKAMNDSGTALTPALGRFVGKFARNSYENIFKWGWLKWPGLFTTDGIEEYLREDILPSNQFSDYAADLFVVATQLNHSKKVVFGKYNYSPPNEDRTVVYMNNTSISRAVAASTSLPPIYVPYGIENEKGYVTHYFDGEIRDTLSTHVGYDAGADLIISSYTHQPYHYSKEIGSIHERGIPWIMIQAIYLMVERKIQAHMGTLERSKATLDAVSEFFKQNNLSDELRTSCLDIIERNLAYKKNIDYIYIHPKPGDHQMYFGDHFNLSTNKMSEVVKTGFKSAIDILRKYEFE